MWMFVAHADDMLGISPYVNRATGRVMLAASTYSLSFRKHLFLLYVYKIQPPTPSSTLLASVSGSFTQSDGDSPQ